MSYQVIARKWRPQTFEEVTGQEAITQALAHAVRSGRLHHAFIFSGPRGVGKTTTARILAKALNCAQGRTDVPCGRCDSCREIALCRSIDVLEIDAASHTGVDNVREVIISNIGLSPARDRYRVYIIDEFHQLSGPAFNALLKTLEEPPSHALFIMATTELHKVPDTILSRCQIYDFKLISGAKIAERLGLIAQAEGVKASEAALRRIAAAGEGSMRDAQSLFDQVLSFSGAEFSEAEAIAALGIVEIEILQAVCSAIAARDAKAILGIVDRVMSQGYDLRSFCRELMGYFRNLLVFKAAGRDPELLPIDESEVSAYRAQAELFAEADLVRGFHLLTEIEQNVRLSSEPRFQMEIGLIKLSQLDQLRPMAELFDRLEKLEGGWREGSGPAPKPNPAPPSSAGVRSAAMGNRTSPRPRSTTPAAVPAAPARAVPPAAPAAPGPEKAEFGEPVVKILNALEEQRKKLLVADMRHASSIRLEEGELRMIFNRSEQSHMEALGTREARLAIEETAATVLAVPVRLKILTAGGETIPSAPASSRHPAMDDPLVQAVVQKFKGEIIDVIDEEKG